MSQSIINFPCGKCKKEVKSDAIECSTCKYWFHRHCAKLTKIKLKYLSNDNIYWTCENCYSIFPYESIDDDEL